MLTLLKQLALWYWHRWILERTAGEQSRFFSLCISRLWKYWDRSSTTVSMSPCGWHWQHQHHNSLLVGVLIHILLILPKVFPANGRLICATQEGTGMCYQWMPTPDSLCHRWRGLAPPSSQIIILCNKYIATLHSVHSQSIQQCSNRMWWLRKWPYYQGWNPSAEIWEWDWSGCRFYSRYGLEDEGKANTRNNQKFINLLWPDMQKEDSIHSLSDTGYDISISACIIAPSKPVVIVDDTELVILLQHCFSPTMHDTIYLQPSTNLVDISNFSEAHRSWPHSVPATHPCVIRLWQNRMVLG